MDEVIPKKLTASGVITAKSAWFYGFLLGMDGGNDQAITIFDNASEASGIEVAPTNTYDASALGLNGVIIPYRVHCLNGIYVLISGGGAVEITVFHKSI